MKKLFSVVLMIVIVLSLSACSNTDLDEKLAEISTLEQEIAALEEAVEAKDQQIDELESEALNNSGLLSEYEEAIETLNEQVAALQELIYDYQITVTYEDYSGDLRVKNVGYDDSFDGSLFDLLDDSFDITAFDSDYGKMITEFEHLSPLNGAYIAFYKNGEMSFVGVDSATFMDGDTFHFSVEFWDTLEQQVEDSISLFLENMVGHYINTVEGEEVLDYTVVTALGLLGELDHYVSDEFIDLYVSNMTLATANDYFKAIALLNAANLDSTLYVDGLIDIAQTGSYGATGRQLIALNSIETDSDFSAFETAALDYYSTNTPYDAGLDSGGIDVMALSKYDDDPTVSALINEYMTWIQTDQLDNGGVMTRDLGWGSSFNAASMAQVVMALIANGENPTSDEFTTNDHHLIDALLMFQTDTGSFDWDLEDDIPEDLMFSTPQAFLALAMYQTYSNNGYEAVHPFDLH
jgi:hypothetical protein